MWPWIPNSDGVNGILVHCKIELFGEGGVLVFAIQLIDSSSIFLFEIPYKYRMTTQWNCLNNSYFQHSYSDVVDLHSLPSAICQTYSYSGTWVSARNCLKHVRLIRYSYQSTSFVRTRIFVYGVRDERGYRKKLCFQFHYTTHGHEFGTATRTDIEIEILVHFILM